LNLEITRLTSREKIYKEFIQEWFKLSRAALLKERQNIKNSDKLNAVELSVVFVDCRKIQELNQTYRSVDRPTDVLSFDGDGVVSMGDLIFCMSVVNEKARAVKLPAKVYLGMLLVHGLLHLLGYEHEQGGDAEAEMFRLQDQIVRKVASKLAPKHKTDFDVA